MIVGCSVTLSKRYSGALSGTMKHTGSIVQQIPVTMRIYLAGQEGAQDKFQNEEYRCSAGMLCPLGPFQSKTIMFDSSIHFTM